MKILFLITTLDEGGAEAQLVRIINELSKYKKIYITVVSILSFSSTVNINKLKALNINYLTLSFKKSFKLFQFYKIFNLMKIVIKIKPNIIHAHMFHANILSRYVKFFYKKIKVINTVHGEEELSPLRIFIYKMSNFLSEVNTTCSNALLKYSLAQKAFKTDQVLMIPNGLDLNLYYFNEISRIIERKKFDYDENTFVWITIGRLSYVKNHSLLIKAFQEHIKIYPKSKLIIVGSGPLEIELKKLVSSINLNDSVIFLGYVNNVEHILNVADAFVLTSNHEGMPLVLQEAISIGLPIICTDVGGCSEFINGNGFLIQKNDKKSLITSMNLMTSYDKDFINKLKTNSLSLRKKYEIKRIINVWLDLYKRITN